MAIKPLFDLVKSPKATIQPFTDAEGQGLTFQFYDNGGAVGVLAAPWSLNVLVGKLNTSRSVRYFRAFAMYIDSVGKFKSFPVFRAEFGPILGGSNPRQPVVVTSPATTWTTVLGNASDYPAISIMGRSDSSILEKRYDRGEYVLTPSALAGIYCTFLFFDDLLAVNDTVICTGEISFWN